MHTPGRKNPLPISMTLGSRTTERVVRHQWIRGAIVRRMVRPALIMRLGKAEIIGFAVRVQNPERYGGIFRRGEKILDVHVPPMEQGTKELIARFGESFEMLRNTGFSGFVGNTPTEPIGRRFATAYNMAKIETHPQAEAEVRAHMDFHIRHSQYPENLRNARIMTIVKRIAPPKS